MIHNLSKRLCELMNIPNLAMRGIIYSALNEWQMKYNKKITEIDTIPLNKRIFIDKEIFDIGKAKLKDMLDEPKEQNEILLDIIFEKGFRFYLEYINKVRI